MDAPLSHPGDTYAPNETTRRTSSQTWPPPTDTGAAVDPFFARNSTEAYCPCCPQEWLDYVLWSNEHQRPSVAAGLEAHDVRRAATDALRVPWDAPLQPVPDPPLTQDWMTLVDLSDHYPITSDFEFPITGPAVANIDGCRNNDDCSFHYSFAASCYCDGPGCTWHGVHKDGWAAGASDPVNDNCHYHVLSTTCVCHKE